MQTCHEVGVESSVDARFTYASKCSGSPAPPLPASGSVSCGKTPELRSGPCFPPTAPVNSLFSPFTATSTWCACAGAQSAEIRASKTRSTSSPTRCSFWSLKYYNSTSGTQSQAPRFAAPWKGNNVRLSLTKLLRLEDARLESEERWLAARWSPRGRSEDEERALRCALSGLRAVLHRLPPF